MSYIDKAYLIARFGEGKLIDLTDRADPPAGTVDDGVLDAAIGSAGAVIDGYVSGRYALPMAAVPALLRDLACDIVLYKLHGTSVPDKVAEDYRTALRQLGAIQAGQITLDVAGTAAPAATTDGVLFTAPDRTFSRDSLRGW